ncbi:MAG: Acetoacetyl-CoA synthetase [Myxococcaceae bacterium]|nr:Acetoacetyl-CoA synthetase [Myxococcaceae bacterium]
MLNLATILRSSAQRTPDKTAAIIGDVETSYAQLHAQSQRFAGALAKLDVRPGQHVALMLPNVPQFTIAYFGALYAATPVVPLNILLTSDEIAHQLDDSDAVALVVWAGYYRAAKAGALRAERCKHLIVVSSSSDECALDEGELDFDSLLAMAEPMRDLAPTSPNDTAVILYTSGTTGQPKGAELTHFSMFYNAEYAGTKLLPPMSDAVALATLPLFHSFGQTSVQNATLLQGGTLVFLPKFEARVACELMAKHKVTHFAGVPTMYSAMLNDPEASQYDLSSLKYALSGGDAMPVAVIERFQTKHRVTVLEGYGTSETSPVASFNVLSRATKPGSIGLPLAHVEFKLVDDMGGEILRPGEPGELCIKGVNVMKGYYKEPKATDRAIKHGWFYTGDVAQRDDDGYYFIVGRIKDMIIRGGFNVYPREIENVLHRHPAVREAAVIGIEHATHGQEIKAVLVLENDSYVTSEQLIAYCKEHLAAYKYPRVIEFRAELLPRGLKGQVLKGELGATAA